MLKLTKNFYENGFTSISPDKATIKPINGQFSIEITHEQVPKQFSITLFYPKDNSYEQEDNACWVNRNPTSAEITCFANYKGLNKLYIYGGMKGQDPLPFLLEYDIDIFQTVVYIRKAPLLMNNNILQGRDFHLTQPLDNPLKRGKFYTFRIKSPDLSNIYIVNNAPNKNNSHFRELDYEGGGVFSGDDVYIFGTEVFIATYQNETYNYIVKYNTIRDTYQFADASFPHSYVAPKNILYKPLLDKLEINKMYTFRIKCESCTRMAVRDGLIFTDLYYKGDSIFSRIITIKGGSDNIVEILNCNEVSCTPMYYYTVSN